VPRPFVDPRFGVTLRKLRLAGGLSLRALAKIAVFGKSYLHDLESGGREPTAATARRLDEVLQAGGLLTRLVVDAPRPTDVDSERLTYSLEHPARLDTGAVESFATVLAHQRRIEDAVGSGGLVTPVLAQANLIHGLVAQSAAARVRDSLFETAAEWACYAGWLAATTGRHAVGRRWYHQSQVWAQAIEHPDLTSSAFQMQGHLAWVQGRHDDMIALSRAAAEHGRSPGVRSVAIQQEARALALIGDAKGCARRLGEAEELAQHRVTARVGSLPSSMPWQRAVETAPAFCCTRTMSCRPTDSR
jgi:transcriptional regulator with XRE-family HTH domain